MRWISTFLKQVVAAVLAGTLFFGAALADEAELEALYEGLLNAEGANAEQIVGRIYEIWSRSGSDSMDLLLERGREALNEGDTKLAIRHFSALVDHAPDFAEGYNARATAYFQAGRYGPSLEDIRRTLQLNPRHFGAMSGLALILEEINRPEDALAAWREVETINPSQEGLAEALVRLERQVEGRRL
ncbi:MAG: tetratricopeptide repeat protein [Silicimonas sp.]|nr:tetratricopeptide repeat protein [Silicimonas sp.]